MIKIIKRLISRFILRRKSVDVNHLRQLCKYTSISENINRPDVSYNDYFRSNF